VPFRFVLSSELERNRSSIRLRRKKTARSSFFPSFSASSSSSRRAAPRPFPCKKSARLQPARSYIGGIYVSHYRCEASSQPCSRRYLGIVRSKHSRARMEKSAERREGEGGGRASTRSESFGLTVGRKKGTTCRGRGERKRRGESLRRDSQLRLVSWRRPLARRFADLSHVDAFLPDSGIVVCTLRES
jgi:hypothetical protein